MQNKNRWGQHLILDMGGCNENISRKESIRAFVAELVDAIDMVAYGEPLIEHFATHSQSAAGYSLVQLIETSAISAHFSDNNRDVYLDVFSCQSFDSNRVVQVVDKYFEPKSIYMLSLGREAKHPVQPPFTQLR
ncbi:MAG: S-adenosylmethionine decarboxylase [Pseudomonadota bacterium]|nr:S-adenosylmethionine decarboxylase [Pseudomonadota bacterium]